MPANQSPADRKLFRTTAGQLLVNEALPEDLRDYGRTLDKGSVRDLFQQIAERYPDKYEEISHKFLKIGERAAQRNGMSITLRDLVVPKVKQEVVGLLRKAIYETMDDPTLTDEQRNNRIIELTQKAQKPLVDQIISESRDKKNRFVELADTGTRGKLSDVAQILGPVMLVSDHRKRTVPVPILNSYAEGLDPAEYALAAFGVRSGYVDIKLATPKVGYLSKQLGNAANRVIAGNSRPIEGTGLPVDAGDPDNVGAALAQDYGAYKAGTIITSKIFKDLKDRYKRILVHSPMTAGSPEGVIPRLALGVRERDINERDNVGITAAQSLSEPLNQGAISSKHGAGVVLGAKEKNADVASGFEGVSALANIPKNFPGAAAVSQTDGTVSEIRPAPQGGQFVKIGGQDHYVDPKSETKVKVGDKVEAGDVLSSGVPNPAEIVQYKGIGEGRRYYMDQLTKTLRASGVNANRRNVELLSRALVDHVQIGDEQIGDYLPGEIVKYDDLAAKYSPRPDAQMTSPDKAGGQYLEQPVLHYSIGTRITPKVQSTLQEFGVKNIFSHKDAPGFEPHMLRAVDIPGADPDPFVRLGGFGLEKNFLEAVHAGRYTEAHSTSYIPSLMKGTEFGRVSGTEEKPLF